MKFRDEDIEKLNSALKIEEVVGKFVALKKSGSNYKGLCPFHDDTSPSFMVSPTKNICKCFVCGAGGGPIKFYSDYKKLTFSQSVKELSETYNFPIKILNETKEERAEYLRYFEIMRLASEYYSDQIFLNSGRVAMEYLSNRGLTPELIKKHNIGYSPNNYNGLTEYMLGKGYSSEELILTGVSKENEKGIYDSFRHRIMFPIYSIDNKVIAFGGRTLETDKDVPKYINSSDTPIFKKGNILYGLGEKHQTIKKKNYSMLMEGYMDVLMSTIHGFDVTLAPLGTALTEEQAKLLKRYTNNVILSFDMDAPGQKATEKAIMILKQEEFTIRVVEINDAKDPDEFIKKFGREAFLEKIQNSIESFDFLYRLYSKEYNLNDILAKQNFIKRFKDFFQCIENKVEISLYIDKLSQNIGIDKDILWEELITEEKNKKRPKRRFEDKETETKNIESKKKNLIPKENEREALSIALILLDNKYFEYFKNREYSSDFLKKILNYIENALSQNKKVSASELINFSEFSDEEKDRMVEFFVHNGSYINTSEQEKLFITLMSDWLRDEIKEFKKQNSISFVENLELKKITEKLKEGITKQEEILQLSEKFNKIFESKFFEV